MKQKKQYHIDWKYRLKSPPEALWPIVSNTNRFFKNMGFYPVQKTLLPANDSDGLLKVGFAGRNAGMSWKEEPFIWEKPFMVGNTRYYSSGLLKKITFLFTLNYHEEGTLFHLSIDYEPRRLWLSAPFKLYLTTLLNRKLGRFLHQADISASRQLSTFESGKTYRMSHAVKQKVLATQKELVRATGYKQIVQRTTEFLIIADNEDLKSINPYALAKQWGKNKYDVLEVFLHATKLELMQFRWSTHCPRCQNISHRYDNLKDIEDYLYCKNCNADYQVDFSKNVELNFRPTPSIRKISEHVFSAGGPQEEPFRVSQHYLEPDQTHYLNLQLERGTYYFKTNRNRGYLKFIVTEDGEDNIEIVIGKEQFFGKAYRISKEPNLVLINNTDYKLLTYLECPADARRVLYASEVTAMQKFRSMFPNELMKDGVKIMASNLSILFTDIINSTDLYLQEGDEFAVDQVMNHFKIIQQVVADEHGNIVKTIGDSVMAIFREPISALTAMDRINQIFSSSKALGVNVKLKAGIHIGDCTTVSINDRIDYFGTAVNLASRLVDAAKEKEIVISEAFYSNPEVQKYLERNKDNLFIKNAEIRLKGFDNEIFKVKQIRLEPSVMRLVI